ncbi:MAG TPA: hypothetical protein VEU47_05795 [Candidatus Cybelea sp.]|nr:hypothetical protein [Candidatus Cybelea sp.]
MRGATYRADHLDGAPPLPRGTGQWSIRNRNSIHMPRWVSRLTLIVTAAKVERLQAISDEEAKAEGAELLDEVTGRVSLDDRRGSYRDGFRAIWESLHGSGAWEANPEVVAISFDIVKANIDATIGER